MRCPSHAPPIVFDKPGVVVLGCNIHDWMIGYIYVSETPFFAKTGPLGTAVISDMPAGEYRVRVWHPSMDHAEESTAQQVTLTADTPANADRSDLGRTFAFRGCPARRLPLIHSARPSMRP
jgi:hypothetical protein